MRIAWTSRWWIGLAVMLPALNGCQIVGVIAENARRDGTHKVSAASNALEGKSFAVIVQPDRAIQGDQPALTEYLTRKITERLAAPTNTPRAGGYVSADDVLRYTYDHPSWNLRPREELARALGGVDALVIVEVYEYRLNDPGNRYIWDGIAAGTVSVFHTATGTPDLAVLEKSISVKFPDQTGLGRDQVGQSVVNTALASRFVDRVSWLFYDHEEPNEQKY